MQLILQSETGAEIDRISEMPDGGTPEVIFKDRAEPPEIYIFHMVGPEGAIYRRCSVTCRMDITEIEMPEGVH